MPVIKKVKRKPKKRVYRRAFIAGRSAAGRYSFNGSGFFDIPIFIFKKLVKPAVACAVFFTVFFYSYRFICASDKFLIEDIQVEGCNNITKTEIEKLIPFKTGDNIFKVGLLKAESDIQKCKPELKNITMSRKWWKNTVVITLKERVPEVFIMNGNKEIIGLDFDNMPFNLRGNMFSAAVPFLKYETDNELVNLLNFVKESKPYFKDFMTNIKEIKFGNVDDIVLVSNEETTIFFGTYNKNNIKNKITKLKIVAEDAKKRYLNIAYIDMSLLDDNKDRIIVKPAIQKN